MSDIVAGGLAAGADALRLPDEKVIFDTVRPWLDRDGFTPRRIARLNAAIAQSVGIVAPKVTSRLADPAGFFAVLRASNVLGPQLTETEVQGCNAIIEACAAAGWPIADTAYALATAYHETAGTMQPIREYGRGRGRRYGAPGRNRGQIPYGRGYVQLTWDENYERADAELELGGALVADYDLALRPDIAARIMIEGMREGWFTARDLDDDLPREGPATLDQFIRSRDIINGTDKARLIGEYALLFQTALERGRWSAA